MSVACIRYQTMVLGLLGGVFAGQAQLLLAGSASAAPAWSGGVLGLFLGFFVGLAPGVFYQRFTAGLLLALLNGIMGLVGGVLSQGVYALCVGRGQSMIGLVVAPAVLGAAIGAMSGVAPGEVHRERLQRGLLGGLLGGVAAGVLLNALRLLPRAGEVSPLLGSSAAGLLIAASIADRVWSARRWLLCLNPSRHMPQAFPVYDSEPTRVGRRLHPAFICLLSDPQVAGRHASIVPSRSADGTLRYHLYREAERAPLQVDQSLVERSQELALDCRIQVGQTQFLFCRRSSVSETPRLPGG